jgi:hypothetical protein
MTTAFIRQTDIRVRFALSAQQISKRDTTWNRRRYARAGSGA